MKKRYLGIGMIALATIALASCNSNTATSEANNESNSGVFNPGDFNPGDNPGGFNPGGNNQTSYNIEYSTLSASAYYNSDYVSVSDYDKDTSYENGVAIDLSSLKTGDYEGYSLSKKGKLTISSEGTYILSGTLNGCVSVDAIASDVKLVLNGVSITTTDTQSSAAIVFKGSDTDPVGARVITVLPNTTNTLSDSSYDTEANDGDEAVIQAKKNSSLTINGSGKLVLNAVGENTSGIKLKEKLVLLGVNIEVNANNNGIKANKTMVIVDSNIKVTALNDGIKTDMEAETAEDANTYASSYEYGYMYINNSSLDITANDDGLSANNVLYIDNRETDLIKIQTNGGAPSRVTESSSNSADGKAIKVAGVTLVENTTETDYLSTSVNNYGLAILGGSFEINSNSDSISSKGNLIIEDGKFDLASGDDGVHSEYLTKIIGGDIDVIKSYEGVEGAFVEINGGTVKINSTDDGINAANGDLNNVTYYIHISGGDVYVNAAGDGIDSNGYLVIDGGKVYVDGPASGANAALDSDNGTYINGGEVIAVGTNQMLEKPADGSTQNTVAINLTSNQSANTVISVYSENKKELLFTYTPSKAYQSIILSLNSFTSGNSYVVVVGTTEYTFTASSSISTIGNVNSGFGSGGGMGPGGGFGPGGGNRR